MTILINFLLTIFVIVSLLLIFIVLMQRPKSEGLGAAFGGGMTENLFGAQTTNVLANFTRWLGGLFFFLALLLSVLYAKSSAPKSAIQQRAVETAKPITAPTPAPAASPDAAAASPSPAAAASPAGGAAPAAEEAAPAASPVVGGASPVPATATTPTPAPAGASPSPRSAAKTSPKKANGSPTPKPR
jgi:preprotein translocase subunit SecG